MACLFHEYQQHMQSSEIIIVFVLIVLIWLYFLVLNSVSTIASNCSAYPGIWNNIPLTKYKLSHKPNFIGTPCHTDKASFNWAQMAGLIVPVLYLISRLLIAKCSTYQWTYKSIIPCRLSKGMLMDTGRVKAEYHS